MRGEAGHRSRSSKVHLSLQPDWVDMPSGSAILGPCAARCSPRCPHWLDVPLPRSSDHSFAMLYQSKRCAQAGRTQAFRKSTSVRGIRGDYVPEAATLQRNMDCSTSHLLTSLKGPKPLVASLYGSRGFVVGIQVGAIP